MRKPVLVALVAGFSFLAFAACGDDDGGSGPRRVVQVAATDQGCTPASIALATGERVSFEVKNDAKKDWEFEGIEGTNIEEVIVPSGRSRNINYTAPSKAGTQKVKCYPPSGGAETVIELKIG